MQEDLALGISIDMDHEMQTFSSLYIEVTLTDKGLQEVDRVIEAVFYNLKLIREEGARDDLLEEIKILS